MRALFSSTRGAGHFNPLVPFARAFRQAGHEVIADQPENARRVAEVGAGLAVEPRREQVDATVAPLRDAVERVLSESGYGERARAIAEELRGEPPVDEAVPLLQRLHRR